MKTSFFLTTLMVCGIGSITNTMLGCGPEFFAPYQEEQKTKAPYTPETECPSDSRFVPAQIPIQDLSSQQENNAIAMDQIKNISHKNTLKKIDTRNLLLPILQQYNGYKKSIN